MFFAHMHFSQVLATLLRHVCIPTPYVYRHIANMAADERRAASEIQGHNHQKPIQCSCCIACINWIRRLEIAAAPIMESSREIYRNLYACQGCSDDDGEGCGTDDSEWRLQFEEDAGPKLQVRERDR
jgi:hypothetical protein